MAPNLTLPPSLRATNRHRWPVADRIEYLQRRQALHPGPPLPLLDWTELHRALLSPTQIFDLDGHRYQAGFYTDMAPVKVFRKPGQSGLTDYAISYALWCLDQRGMNLLYLMPTISDVSDFSQMRLGPALEASAYLSRLVVDAAGRDSSGQRQRGADRVRMKRLRGNFLSLRGAQVHSTPTGERRGASQVKSIPADAVIFDEFDEMPPAVEPLAQKRLGHSAHKEMLYISTPTYPGVGIDARYEASDQRLWFIPCPACGRRQHLTIEHVVIEWDDLERPAAWHGRGEGRAYAACEHCGAELDRLAEGEWVAAYPGRAIAGYAFNKLITAQTEVIEVVRSLMATEAWKRQEAWNQDLGLPYHPQGEALTDADLDALRRDYRHGPQAGEVGCVMGVDVGRVLHVVIRGPARAGDERPQRLAVVVSGFEEVGRLLQLYKVSACVIDALPETRAARAFQRTLPRRRVWLAYFHGGQDKGGQWHDWKEEGGKGADPWAGTVTIDRTRAFDALLASMLAGEGAWTLPAHARDVRDYYAHLKAPLRVLERRRQGPDVARYVSAGPDHFALAELYALAASKAPRAPIGVLVQSKVRHPPRR